MKNPTEIAVLRMMLRQRSALMTRVAELGSSVGDMLPRPTVVPEFFAQSDAHSPSPQG